MTARRSEVLLLQRFTGWTWVVVAVLSLCGCLLNNVDEITHKTGSFYRTRRKSCVFC
jgi:uncharacterized membrane protein